MLDSRIGVKKEKIWFIAKSGEGRSLAKLFSGNTARVPSLSALCARLSRPYWHKSPNASKNSSYHDLGRG